MLVLTVPHGLPVCQLLIAAAETALSFNTLVSLQRTQLAFLSAIRGCREAACIGIVIAVTAIRTPLALFARRQFTRKSHAPLKCIR
jgi:hypothetical protein